VTTLASLQQDLSNVTYQILIGTVFSPPKYNERGQAGTTVLAYSSLAAQRFKPGESMMSERAAVVLHARSLSNFLLSRLIQ
jgi:hypothetical protein